ncbi:alpha/beta fold hydrolase [Pontivivens insulae]|uniref:2-hydroxymuconate semialdehyde hydrolase n=1 Tax=Pontivivens insulae TaxID=1639689 RepID=A0A2R8AAK7_9RHOB|nr:alpha/beta hydrolase [Pontivivens insulae]RED13171.1 pimeloyl-ACP methyl ester carboxylesterase [Pontivivens insulae]SPF29263.1 2-hydroxymuconate semialdehyde hydrolase [Pontivivens insulae]
MGCLTEPTGQFLTVGKTRLHYRQVGTGPDLVALHGASGNLRDWDMGQLDRLAKRWRVTLFDRPGAGFTTRAPGMHNPHRQAALLRAALTPLGVKNPVLLGHSFGGTVALAWALDAPDTVKGLCLMAAPSHPWPGTVGRLYEIGDLPWIGALVAWAYPRLASDRLIDQSIRNVFHPDQPPQNYRRGLCAELATRYATVRANIADINRLKPYIIRMAERYGGLALPVEILHGDHDGTVPLDIHSRRLAPVLPNGRLQVLENTGHMPHHSRQDDMFAALERLREA